LLLMLTIRIFGAPTACSGGVSDGWRSAGLAIGGRLVQWFGEQVHFEYVDLLKPEMDRFPRVVERISSERLQLPIVFIEDELFSAGGKINGPGLRRRVEEMLSASEPAKEQEFSRHGLMSHEVNAATADSRTRINECILQQTLDDPKNRATHRKS
jgi:disulfide oxidoreductase YuzD